MSQNQIQPKHKTISEAKYYIEYELMQVRAILDLLFNAGQSSSGFEVEHNSVCSALSSIDNMVARVNEVVGDLNRIQKMEQEPANTSIKGAKND